MNEDHTRTIFDITVFENTHPDIRRIKRKVGDATIHGNPLI